MLSASGPIRKGGGGGGGGGTMVPAEKRGGEEPYMNGLISVAYPGFQ